MTPDSVPPQKARCTARGAESVDAAEKPDSSQ